MSEYQRYEFMTIDRPLTRAQLDAVNALSSHITASSTHAVVEYHWGNFKHDPIKVLHQYFDAFLYWANWGSPRLGLRFPHGVLPADLLGDYDLDGFVTFTRHADYDVLDIRFGEMGAPDEWTEYDLGSLIGIRDELMEGDLRALYVAWLASNSRPRRGYYYGGGEDEDYDDEEENEEYEEEGEVEEDETTSPPAVPANFGNLTAAQQALAELLQVPDELLVAAGQHSNTTTATSSTMDDFVAWVELLSQERRNDYLVRLAHHEPGLGRLLVRELRELGQGKTKVIPQMGERIAYATLLAESKTIKDQQERERREQERLARERHLQGIHEHQETYWRQVDLAVVRGNASGYDEGLRLLVELRDAAEQFKEGEEFQGRFSNWVRSHLRRPAFIKRLHDRKFRVPGV